MKKQAAAKKNPDRQWQPLMPCVALGLCGLIVYWNSFDVPFVFDDLLTITGNYNVRFSWENWQIQYFLRPRSLLFATFRLNSWLGELAVWHYHLVNLLLHLANAILVFYIGRHIFRLALADSRLVRMYSFLAACFFTVHPVQTEAVTYISSRSELLSTFFYASAFLLFIKWPPQRIGFLSSLIVGFLFLLGLGGKETVISLPAVLLVYDYLFISGLSIRVVLSRWRFYATFAVGGVAAAYYLVTGPLAVALRSPGTADPWQYFMTESRVIVRYIEIIFLPIGLNLDYDIRIYSELWNPVVLFSGCLLASIVLAGWFLRRTQPVIAFSIFWFFITLSPTSSFVPILDVIFEHRLYLPLVGVSLSFPIALHVLSRLFARYDVKVRVAHIAVVILLALGVATILRNEIWRDETRLWQDTIDKSPRKQRPYYSLMYAYFKNRDYRKGIAVAELARQRLPEDMWQVNNTLGNLYLKLGQYEDAVRVFSQNISGDPTGGLSANNLGTTYRYLITQLDARKSSMSPQEFENQRRDLLEKTEAAFKLAVDRAPEDLNFLDAYVNTSFENGHGPTLEAAFKEKLRIKETVNALYGLGKLASLKGDSAAAVGYFERVAKFKNDRLLDFNLAYAWSEVGDFNKSIENYKLSIKEDPDIKETYYNLGSVYMRMHDLDSAIQQFKEVLRMDPDHIFTHIMLAKIYIQKSDRAAALEHLEKVLTLSPANREARALKNQLLGAS